MSKIVFIDPGHGGHDPGAVGNRLLEKDITLQIGLLLEEYLKNDPNYEPYMSRRSDVSVSIDARWQAANALNADLLLSIHLNSAAGTNGDGFECYPKVPGTALHEESLRFAKLLAENIQDIQNLRGIDGVRYAYLTDGKIRFAESDDKNPNRYKTYYGVCRNAKCSAVLTELAFISNPEDIRDFDEDQEWKAVAERYYRAVCGYFGTSPVPNSHNDDKDIASPLLYRVRRPVGDPRSQISDANDSLPDFSAPISLSRISLSRLKSSIFGLSVSTQRLRPSGVFPEEARAIASCRRLSTEVPFACASCKAAI